MKTYTRYLWISLIIIAILTTVYFVINNQISISGTSFYKIIVHYQELLRTELSKRFISHRKESDITTYLFIILISYIYGVIHSLGPGHGKFILSSLLLSEKKNYRQALKASFTMGTLHSLSAVLIVLSIYYILKLPVTAYFDSSERIMRSVTAFAVIIIALYQFYTIFRNSGHSHTSFHGIVISSGLVPCPVTSIILLFALNLKMLDIGLLSVVLMSVGISSGIFLSAFLTLFLKNRGKNIIDIEKPGIYKLIRIIGTTFILLTGILILI